jgi:general stress protein YciG
MGVPDTKNPSGEKEATPQAAAPEEETKPQVGQGEPVATSSPEEAPPPAEKPKQRRGFAAMDRAKVRAIAMLGGAAVHRKGTAHRFSHEEAREAGRKGGLAPHRVRGRKLPTASTEDEPAKPPKTPTNPTEEG